MKKLILTLLFVWSVSAEAGYFPISADRLFVPGGFDDNDRAEIVLDGFLTQSCHELVDPFVSIDLEQMEIAVSAQVEENGDDVCSDDLRAFTQVVVLGVLPFGKYLVHTNRGSLQKSLRIFEANSSGPDEEFYAYLTDAYIRYRDDLPPYEGQWAVILKGYFEDACQEWDYVEVIGSDHMIEVLPVVTAPDAECPPKLITFTKQVNLPPMVEAGRYLLHVRSRGEESFNEVFSVLE